MVMQKEIFKVRTDPKRFANNRPNGQEVVDWLGEKGLSSYIPVFLYHGLDTLFFVSRLSHAQVSQLAEEYRDLNSLNHKPEALSRVTFGDDAGGHTAERDESVDLWLAISSLERDPRARTMTERLEWFEDSAAAWHSRSEFTHPKHGPLSKFRWLTPKQSRLTHILTLTHEHTRSMGKIEHRTIHGASDNFHHSIRAIALESGGNAKKLCHVV
jgi:hypothetical protein